VGFAIVFCLSDVFSPILTSEDQCSCGSIDFSDQIDAHLLRNLFFLSLWALIWDFFCR
jgi:hypothetical protein